MVADRGVLIGAWELGEADGGGVWRMGGIDDIAASDAYEIAFLTFGFAGGRWGAPAPYPGKYGFAEGAACAAR